MTFEKVDPTTIAAAGLTGALLLKGNLRYAGLAVAAWGGWKAYENQRLMNRPDLMNGYFQTGGMLSATRGEAQSAALTVAKERMRR